MLRSPTDRARDPRSAPTDPLRGPFEAGAADRRGPHQILPLLTVLVPACVACVVLASAMVAGERTGVRLVEAPVSAGSWAIGWDEDVLPPTAEQEAQTSALRGVAAGSAWLLAILALVIAVGSWRQRLRLRRAEDYVHWAAGARRAQLAARLVGEGWRWGVVGLAATIAVAYLLPLGMERTFPGRADVPPGLAVALIVATAFAVVLLGWESRAGERAARASVRSRPVASSPTAVAAIGFTVLTGVGLLSEHAPGQGRDDAAEERLVTRASLEAIAAERRADVLAEWIARATGSSASVVAAGESRDADAPGAMSDDADPSGGRSLGVASAGATRGTGHLAKIWVECGRCFEGGLPLPIRTVRAEVQAVAADTFPHLGLELTDGRDFDDRTDRGAPAVAIVSGAMAGRYFERGQAIGRRIRIGDSDWLTVVGVVSDAVDVRDHSELAVYLPLPQAAPSEIEVFGVTSGEAMGAWIASAPEGVVTDPPVTTAGVFAMHGWFARLLGVLGGCAYLLVLAGVWLGSRNEARATVFELSLRRALGARRRDLLSYFGASSGRRLSIALGAGAWLSLFLGAGLAEAYGSIPQIDGWVWLRSGALVSAAYLVGAWPPFARAARMPPVAGLRSSE